MTKAKRPTDGADLGVLYAAWWLHRSHGEDEYAADMLLEWGGKAGLKRLRALALAEDYVFQPSFWSAAMRRSKS